MAISPTTNNASMASNLSLDKGLKLFVGQTLMATVTKVEGNRATLTIGNQTLTANLKSDLPETKQFQVTVTQLKPETVLTIKPATSDKIDLSVEKLIQQTLKQTLPNQTSLSQGLGQLIQLTQTGGLPPGIQVYLNRLFDSLFKLSGRTSTEELKNQILSSGLFMENRLSQKKPPSANDFKAQVLKLIQLVQAQSNHDSSELKSLTKTLSQLLNRIVSQQVNALENPNAMHIELPIAPKQPLIEMSLDIRKVPGRHTFVWETVITLEMESGTLISKCILQDDHYSFQFWTESDSLEAKLQTHLPLFEEQLRQSGLKIKHLAISKHKPEATQTATKVALIDITV